MLKIPTDIEGLLHNPSVQAAQEQLLQPILKLVGEQLTTEDKTDLPFVIKLMQEATPEYVAGLISDHQEDIVPCVCAPVELPNGKRKDMTLFGDPTLLEKLPTPERVAFTAATYASTFNGVQKRLSEWEGPPNEEYAKLVGALHKMPLSFHQMMERILS